tara:strand:+ start:215 stop:1063 length:849 start_codon:yes stop_codon:yes gene_type:complete
MTITFIPSGKYAQTVFANPDDNSDKTFLTKLYALHILDISDKLPSDIILGITLGQTSYQLVAIREQEQTDDDVEFNPAFVDQPCVTFIAIGNFGLQMTKLYEIKMMDTGDLRDDDDLESLDDQTIGMFITEESKSIVLYVDKSRETLLPSDEDAGNKSIKCGVKPALDPIQFGTYGILKDWRSAVDHWVVSLDIPKVLRKCDSGKTHYEQYLNDTGTWKNVNTYKEILQIGKTATGRDMYEDFAKNCQAFPSIAAQGKSAFKRDWKRKQDSDMIDSGHSSKK